MGKIKIKVGDKIYEGEEKEFEVIKEDWNEYRLKDGCKIKVKTILTNILEADEKSPEKGILP